MGRCCLSPQALQSWQSELLRVWWEGEDLGEKAWFYPSFSPSGVSKKPSLKNWLWKQNICVVFLKQKHYTTFRLGLFAC